MHYYPVKGQHFEENDSPFALLRQEAQRYEEESLNPSAALSRGHSRYYGAEDDHRLPYKRDVDRIVHSKAYARYVNKTQVVYLVENDHITQRSLHVQLVSNFSRGIAEILRLNLDLVEAISLGHDVGHPPFGHEGEGYLSHLSEEYGNGLFTHAWQSCRLFNEIEPLNLGLATYDGFLCHDGGMCSRKLEPRYGKSWDDHFVDLEQKVNDPEKPLMPATLEGCLVRICDTISYLGRDLEDAVSLGILTFDQIPDTILGKRNREILSYVGRDIITNSCGKDFITLSDDVFEALLVLRKFNFANIYSDPRLKVESEKIKRSYRILFEQLLNDLKTMGEQSYVWHHYVNNKTDRYKTKTSEVQMIVDFIAGMTDQFFIRTIENFAIPKKIHL